MDANPNDGAPSLMPYLPILFLILASVYIVVTLLIVNIDNLAASEYDKVFNSAGLKAMSYSPPSATLPASGWPTLGDMIDKGTRLVTFLDNGAQFDTAPYLIDG